ncbi:MAG: hypothetical protein SO238_00055 [Treponema sp.]|nr:hypothetical protein [Treponema sp.]
MNLFKSLSKSIFLLCFFCAFLVFESCDVGLGESVDTIPPTISITYPPTSSVIRDAFVVSGTWVDDKGVSLVKLTLKNEETGETVASRFAGIGIGTWNTSFNVASKDESGKLIYPIPDGKYTISVTAMDLSGRISATSYRSIEIDNTAPVFVISNPGVLVDNNSSSALKASPFGSIFRIVGSIAEAHSVKSMEVKVFAKNGEGEPIASWKEEDINISGGTSVTFARFTNSKDKNDYLHKRYIDIYGDGTTGSKEFSCSVTLTDSAGVYQSDSYSDSNTLNYNGNKTSVVWLNDDINAGKDYDLLSKNANPQFEIGDLMKILNGTYNSSLTGKDSKAALNTLRNTIKNTEEKKLAFSINKDANPTYSILGYGFDDTNYDEPNHFYKIISKAAQKGMLALRAQYGQDGTYFFPKELKVYVFGPYIPKEITDMEYNALPADERDKYLTRQKLAEIYDSVDNYYDTHKDNKDGECAWLIWDGSKEALDEGSTSNYSVSVQLPEDIKANNYYVIAVTGVDKDGLNFIPENSGFYGLIGASNGVPPVISLDSIEQGSYHKDINFLSKISGNVKSTETVIESVTYRVKILDILNKNNLVGVISGSALADEGKEFLNAQDINYYFGITEEQLIEKGVDISEGKMYAFEISVDGLDNTGGTASKSITAYLDTKKPEIKISSVSPIAKEKVVNEQTKQIINGIVKVIANVTEEYLENVNITVKDGNGKTYSPSVSSGSYIAFDFNTTEFKSDSQEDAITIEISAVDKAGNYNILVDNSYVINQSSDKPLLETDTKEQSECSFEQIAVNNNLFGIKSNNKLTATITDDDGIGAITAVIYQKDGTTVKDNKQTFSPAGKKTYNLNLNMPKEEGEYVVSIEVKDIYYDKNEDGTETTDAQKSLRSFKKSYNVAVDAGNPAFNITTVNNAMTAANTAKTVEGTASDSSGLKSLVRYAVNKNDDSAEKTDAETWWFADPAKNDGKANTITFDGTTFTDTIVAAGIGGNDGRRRYIATDIYGNESIIDFVYFVDNVAPVITEITNPAGGSAIYNGNNIFALKGKANDNKDLDTIRFCVLENTDSDPVTVESPIDADKTIYNEASLWQPGTFATSKNGDGTTDFTCNIDLSDEEPGEYNVFIALFDKANNQSCVSSVSKIVLKSDKNAPVTQTVAVSKTGYNLEDYTALSEIVISVKASDDVGLKSITVSKGGSELTKLNVNETEFDGTVILPVSKEAGKETLVDGTNTFSVVSTDLAGNSSETKTFTITLDSTPPDVSISSVTPIAAEEGALNVINGVITIKGSVIESNLKSATLEISDTSEPKKTKKIELDTGKSIFTEKVDTTQFIDGTITIKLSATDKAGNNKELSETSYKVLQSSDSPSIETETSDSCTLEQIAVNNNLFGTKSNNKLTATITDDDGIAKVTAVIYNSDGTVKDDSQIFNLAGKKTFNLALKLPSEEAKYVVKINAKDIYYDFDDDGEATDDIKKARRSFEKFYNVGVDAGDPVLSLKTANNAMIAANTAKTVEGIASDSGGLFSLVRYAIDSGDVTGAAETWWFEDTAKNGDKANTITIEGSAFTDTITAAGIGDTDGRRRYIATDIYGNTSTLDFIYSVDSFVPVIKVDPSVTFANGEWRASKTQKVQVLVNDTGADGNKRSSGITNVKYVIDPVSANEAAIKEGTDLAIGASRDSNGTTSGNRVYNIYSTTFDFADDGTHLIYAGTWDSVGNYGHIASPITYRIDTIPPKTPELLGGTGEAKDSVAEPISMNANSHEDFNVYVTSDDKNGDSEDVSGIKKIIIRKGSTDVEKYELNSAAVAVDSRKITISADEITEGTNTFTVYSVDAVGNESIASSPITINYDGTAPEVKFTSHKAEDSIYKTITLKGSVHEANGLSSEDADKPVLQYKLHSASEWKNAVAGTDYASISVADGIWTVTGFDTTKLDNTDTPETYDLRLVFTDKYGNKNADAGITVSVDQNADRPVISLTTISEQNEVVSSRTIYGNVTDSDGTVQNLWVIENSEFDSVKSFADGLPKEFDPEKTEEENENCWIKAKLNNSGSWSVNFNSIEDSAHNLYFCVQDKKGDIFYTTETNTTAAKLARPRIALSGVEISNAVDNNEPLSFSIDTVPPKITMYVSNEALAADAVDGNGNTLWAAAGLILGGTKNQLHIKLEVIENNIVRTGAGTAGSPYVYRLPSLEIAGKPISPVALRDSTVTGDGTAESPFVFLLAPITLEKATYSSYEGSKSVMATLPDISGQEGQGGTNIILDYTAPTVQIISPTAQISDAVSAAVTVKGIVTDNYSAIERLEYVIPRKDDVYNTTSANWAQVYNSGASWEIEFSSGSVESTESLCYYGKNYANYTGASEVTSGLGVYKVPMWFRATDSVGNIGTITVLDPNDAEKAPELFVYVDPDGGKPKAWINSPESGTVTSGNVTIYGGASDNVSVSRVCIQIDADNDGDFDKDDFTKLKTDLSIPTPVSYNAPSFNTGDLVASSAQDKNDWYIVAEGTNSWKYTYNSSLLTERDSKKNLRVRVRAIDNDGQTRVYSEANDIKIDSTVPWFTNVRLCRYGSSFQGASDPDADTPVVAEREYVSGMYISDVGYGSNGIWYLVANVNSNTPVSNVSSVSIPSTTSIVIDLAKDGTETFVAGETLKHARKTSENEYTLTIPLDTTQSGVIQAEISAVNTVGNGSQQIKINIDSTPPALYNKNGSETYSAISEGAGDNKDLRVKSQYKTIGKNGTSSSAEYATIENSDGFFTFGDSVKESGSGLQYLAFYFKNTVSNTVYDPMNSKTGNVVEADSKTNGKLYINEDNLAAFYIANATRNAESTFEYSDLDAKFVRKGGLVKIGGTYHLISEVNNATKTVSFAPGVSKAFKEVEIIYAQVVDHMLTESFEDEYDEDDNKTVVIMNDDGDGMCETINQIGSVYQWTASINSNNIPDGTTEICVAAIDNAGNISSGKVESMVANNRPRITKVFIGTDLNGNSKYDFDAEEAPVVSTSKKLRTADGTSFGEFNYYGAYDTRSGFGRSTVTIASNKFKVTNGLCVIPEFTGGNGSLKYVLTDGEKSEPQTAPSPEAMTTRDSLNIKTVTGGISMFGNTAIGENGNENPVAYGITDNSDPGNPVTYGDFGGIVINNVTGTDGEVKTLSFTFWDETDGKQNACQSQWAILNVPVTIKSGDSVPPVPRIKPFHWLSATDNSILIEEKIAKGHIELEDDLAGGKWSEIQEVFRDTEALKKPKVSGKIKLEGTVYDDVRLSSIKLAVFGRESTVVSNYTNGAWVPASLPTGVVSFTAEDLDMSQNGHTVKYTAVIDTEKTSVGIGKTIVVNADDWNGNTVAASGSSQTKRSYALWSAKKSETDAMKTYFTDPACTVAVTEKTNDSDIVYKNEFTDYYIMDVVPYVTEIVTPLSAYNAGNPSVYARTALGSYPVKEGSSVEFRGFNLGTNAAKVTISGMTAKTSLSGGNKITIEETSSGKTGATSGAVSVYVNDIPAINNLNNNNAQGNANKILTSSNYEDYAYNRQPNGINNNMLTDDLAIDVWQFKDAARPVNGGAELVTMKINPKTGVPGFSYANSVLYFNMPAYNSDGKGEDSWGADNKTLSGSQYSQIPVGMNYGGFSHNSFCFDDYGYSYGAAMCTDTQDKDSSAYLQFFSRETPISYDKYGQDMNYGNCANASRIDMSTMDLSGNGSNYQTNINRIQSISMDTSYSGGANAPSTTTPVYVYMSYFDDITKQVRFRWGTVGDASDNIDGKYNSTNSDNQFSRVGNSYGLDDVINSKYTGYAQDGKNTGKCRENAGTDTDSYIKYSNENNSGVPVQVIAQSTVQSTGTVRGAYKQSTTYKAGKYVAMGIVDKKTTSPKAVVFWSDGLKLYMAYNENPTTTKVWTSKIVDNNGGLNVKCAVDSDGGIHVAYYTTNGGNLKYAYLSSYTATPSICVVDANGAVGTKCTIDVVKNDSGKQVPYISYQLIGGVATYNAKVAYRTDFTQDNFAGADEKDFYTGKWEISVVPTSSLLKDDTINIGLWRDSDGKAQVFTNNPNWKSADILKYGGTAGSSSFETVKNSTMDVGSPSIVYGNNTANPIVGYGVESGAIEIAQKK